MTSLTQEAIRRWSAHIADELDKEIMQTLVSGAPRRPDYTPGYQPQGQPGMLSTRLMGLRLGKSWHAPEFKSRVELSRKVECTEPFRQEFQQWLDDFFGRERVYFQTQDAIIMHPNNYEALRLHHPA